MSLPVSSFASDLQFHNSILQNNIATYHHFASFRLLSINWRFRKEFPHLINQSQVSMKHTKHISARFLLTDNEISSGKNILSAVHLIFQCVRLEHFTFYHPKKQKNKFKPFVSNAFIPRGLWKARRIVCNAFDKRTITKHTQKMNKFITVYRCDCGCCCCYHFDFILRDILCIVSPGFRFCISMYGLWVFISWSWPKMKEIGPKCN